MGILAKCPSCGLASNEIRCPRCNTLKVVGCSGSCAGCKSGCEDDSSLVHSHSKVDDDCGFETVVLVWQRVPTAVRNLAGLQAYALGMYVVPELRRQGVARELVTRSIDCAAEHGASLVALHASDPGMPLSERLGFTLTSGCGSSPRTRPRQPGMAFARARARLRALAARS